MQFASRVFHRPYTTHIRAKEGRALSTPKSVRKCHSAQGQTNGMDSDLTPSKFAKYQCSLALGSLMGQGKDGGEPTEKEWLSNLNEWRTRIRGIRIEKREDGSKQDSTVSTSLIAAVSSYKSLGVIFDPALCWKLQHAKVQASATFWSSKIWCLSKTSSGLKPNDVRQLYMTVAVPRFMYGAEVWYTPALSIGNLTKTKGSVAITNKLRSSQRLAAKTVTGALSTTAGDILDIHTNLFPVDLLMSKILYRSATQLCSLPKTHPLHSAVRKAARRQVKHHRSPLHDLMQLVNIDPDNIETITVVRRSPSYIKSFSTYISELKEQALDKAEAIESTHPVQVFCDGSGFEGGIGASAVLFVNNQVTKTLHYHLGSDTKHTVYEAEGVVVAMALHLLKLRNRQLTHPTSICSDSQALLLALNNQHPHAGHYILDKIHDFTEDLHAKQDGLFNRTERCEAITNGLAWEGRKSGVIDLQLHWVPGHSDYARNERADEEAKKAAQGLSSNAKCLPSFLPKPLPVSISALRQDHLQSIRKMWKRCWK
jgi:ribonuclease HI